MSHAICHVQSFESVGPYTLQVTFDDASTQTIDFQPVLNGPLYRPLRDLNLFNQVQLDREVRTLVWPNGADFDPATLHDWPEHMAAFVALTRQWELEAVSHD